MNATMMLEEKFNEEMQKLSNLHQYNIRNIQNEYSRAINTENTNFEKSKNELMGLFYSLKQQIKRSFVMDYTNYVIIQKGSLVFLIANYDISIIGDTFTGIVIRSNNKEIVNVNTVRVVNLKYGNVFKYNNGEEAIDDYNTIAYMMEESSKEGA